MSEPGAEADIGAADQSVPLSFEAWVDLSARLMGLDRKARLDILYAAGLDVEDWTRCERHYAPAIGDDIAHGRMDRATQYAERCASEMERRRAAERATTPANGGGQDEPAAKGDDGAPLKIGAPPEEGPIDARFLDTPLTPSAPESPPADQTTTAAVLDLPAALRAGALPFKPSATPSLPGAAPVPSPPPPAASGPEGTMVLGGTAAFDPAMVAKAALPFAAAGAAPMPVTGPATKQVTYPRMPLATYAAMCAELTTYPQHTPEIRKRYGIDGDEAQAALEHAWRARLDASAEVRAEWEALVKKHRERVLGQPK